ncbi:MAG: outer membrane beta-barrel protein [Gemmatimonadota bacterium]
MRYLATTAMLVALSAPVLAQQGAPVELGMDATLSTSLDSPHRTGFALPASRIRIGFENSPSVSIEPAGSLELSKVGSSSATILILDVGALFHFSADRTASRTYVRPFVGFGTSSVSSSSTSNSTTNLRVGAGLGAKIPMSNRLASRFEATVTSTASSGSGAHSELSLSAGLSFFTH